MTALYLLGLKRLLARPLVVLLSIIGIAGGVALVISVNVVLGSVSRSIDEITDLNEGASLSLTARSPLGFPIELAERAGEDPAVESVQPQLTSEVLIGELKTVVIGRLDIAQTLRGTAFDTDQLTVRAGGSTTELVATEAPTEIGSINGGAVLFLPMEQAWDVTGRHGLVDSAGLMTNANADQALADRLEAELGPPIYVAPADAQREFALTQLQQVQQPLLLMASIALAAGGFLVFNTVQNSARSQARELAVLRALGAGRRQVSAGLLLEAVVLGAVGSALGVAGGAVLGREIVGVLPDLADSVAGTKIRFHWDWRALPGAVVAGIAVSALSAALPIRAMLKSRPDHVLSRRPSVASGAFVRPMAIAAGALIAFLGLVMTRSTETSIAQNGIGLVFLGVLIFAFGISGPIARAASSIASRFGAIGSLSAVDIRGSDRRVWAVAVAVLVAVATALSVGGAARNQGDTLNEQFQAARSVDLWVSAAEADDLPIGFFYPSDSIEDLRTIDGVTEVRSVATLYSEAAGKQIVLLASNEALSSPSLRLAGEDAVAQVASGEAVVVTIQFARAFDVDVGDVVDIPGSQGRIQLPVAGITKAIALSVNGAVHVSRDALFGAFGDIGVNTFEIQTAADADLSRVGDDIRTTLESSGGPVVVNTGQQWFDGILASTVDTINVFLIVSSAVVAVAGIATLNATASSVVERRRQLGVLRSIGATPKQVRSLVMVEAASAGLVGALVGAGLGAGMHWLAVFVTTNSTPFPQDYFFSWPAVIQALASAAVAVAVGGLLPAIQASRLRIADALAFD